MARLSPAAWLLLDKVRRLRYRTELVGGMPPTYSQDLYEVAQRELIALEKNEHATEEERLAGMQARRLGWTPLPEQRQIRWFNY